VLSAEQVLEFSDDELEPMVEHWYVPSRRMRFVRRNALIALGNTGDESDLGLLSRYLRSEDALLAGHAAWAIGRIGGRKALSICCGALESESDGSVREELRCAIIACRRGGVYADVLPEQ
jgi:epoxyqueuosine reductase